MPELARQCSPWLDRMIERHPREFESLERSGRLQATSPPDSADLAADIERLGLDPGLRRFRNREMMRIVWRELERTADLEDTLGDLTTLAEIVLDAAIDRHRQALGERFGVPRDEKGMEQNLVVLGLGKLGGGELNLSSDIDLVFCFPSGGECDGRRNLSNGEFFTRIARSVIASLTEVTEEGFCFRVDTRLRPFGESGPLVCSFGAMEQYYQREGRDWERYALVKARPVAGDRDAGKELLGELTPFVYRRYIDFGAVEALREMLASVHADARRKSREDDIKRGPGGIREIEFLVQCVQLLRGGRQPTLQTPSLRLALDRISELSLLPTERVEALREDYRFLRRLENAIQALHDQQTHSLPVDQDLERVTAAMRLADPEDLRERLAGVRERTTQALLESFPEAPGQEEPERDWRSEDSRSGLAGKPWEDFRSRLARTPMSHRAQQRLDHFMPLLIERLENGAFEADVQTDLLDLVHSVCRRSAYLSLLVQNPRALDRMVELFDASRWVARTVIRYPALLDELIDPALGRMLPDREEIRRNVDRVFASHPDTEAALQSLNYMKRSYELRIAVAEIEDVLSADDAQQRLTDLAEAMIAACLELAGRLMAARHGRLADGSLAVIAYGTLGAHAMSYGSDLDLVFLYEAGQGESDGERPLPAEQYYTRLTRRMLGLVTSPTPTGRLYEVDTRLRPNGRAGLLVSSLNAFARYQSEEAWVWELQALVRARAIAGSAAVSSEFANVRESVLLRGRDKTDVRSEVRDMRQRMRGEFRDGDPFKHVEGGLVDIDFVAQLGILESASEHPHIVTRTSTTAQLDALAGCGWLERRDADVLVRTHRALTQARHFDALSRRHHDAMPETDASWAVCRRFLE